jgi:hypothetical protein
VSEKKPKVEKEPPSVGTLNRKMEETIDRLKDKPELRRTYVPRSYSPTKRKPPRF